MRNKLDNTPLLTDSFLPRGLSCSFPSSVKPWCSHPFETAPLWFLFLSSFSEFHDSMHWRLCTLDDPFPWVAVPPETESDSSSRRYFASPYNLLSSPGQKNVQCPCKNFFACVLTSLNLIVFPLQSMSLNIDMNVIRSVNTWDLVFRSCKYSESLVESAMM